MLDISVSLVLLIATSPLLICAAVALYIANDGQVLFRQTRPGKNAVPFLLYKYKTMNDAVDEQGELLPDAARLTPVGRIVRKSSIDELPQLVNVLLGDMSLIGPRPLLVDYLPLYSVQQQRRHEVRPGITGLAQVKGRNKLGWQRRFRYDVFYVDHISFRLDLQIIWWTIGSVLFAKGIYLAPDGRFTGRESKKTAQPETHIL